MKVAIVVPTCRGYEPPKQSIPVTWYVVHDQKKRKVPPYVNNIVAPDPTLYGECCDSIRSAGFLRAAQDGAQVICTTDDDCFLPHTWAEEHVRQLTLQKPVWTNTIEDIPVRGMPTENPTTPVAIHHGVWDGVPDVSGLFQLNNPRVTYRHYAAPHYIDAPFPQSAMNFSFVSHFLPVMYQPAQGKGTPFDRYADIWGGVLAQRVLSQFGYKFRNGGAVLYHMRASDAIRNVEKEKPGDAVHGTFWKHIWNADITAVSLEGAYKQLAEHVKTFEYDGKYFSDLGDKMIKWVELCEKKSV